VLIFDGGCGFCRRSLRWAYAAGGRFEAVSNQEVDPAPLGLTHAELREAVWWVAPDGSLHRGHEAIAQALLTSRWFPACSRAGASGHGWRA